MTPAVSGPVAIVTLILPAADILNGVATAVGTTNAFVPSDALAVAARMLAAPEHDSVDRDRVADRRRTGGATIHAEVVLGVRHFEAVRLPREAGHAKQG